MTVGDAVVPSGLEAVFGEAKRSGRLSAAQTSQAARGIDVMIVTDSVCRTLSQLPRDLHRA